MMKNWPQRFIALTLILGLGAPISLGRPGQKTSRLIDRLHFPELHFSPPQPERVTLANGMTVFILEDHEIPNVDMFAAIRSGSVYDPPEKIGLAELMGMVMRTGGTISRTPEQINEQLEFIAASVETGMTREYGTASLTALTKDLDIALPILADILMHPAFRQEQLDVAKNQMLDALKRRNDTPQQMADRIFPQLIYGKDHPLARVPQEETIRRITRQDLIDFHARFYHPNNVILGISGDVTKEEIVKKVERAFAGWEPQETTFPPIPPVERRYRRAIYFIPRDLNQTTIRIGHIGLTQRDPDFFPVTVAAQILGGGFSSRMFNELRSKEGLAYAAFAGHTGGLREPGYFFTFSETRADATVRAIRTILRLLEEIRQKPVSDAELRIAKEGILNSFVFDFDSPEKIVHRTVLLEYFGLPLDFLQRYRDNVAKVTKQDVSRVARKYFRPDGAIILVIGKEEAFDKPLSALGEVITLDMKEWK